MKFRNSITTKFILVLLLVLLTGQGLGAVLFVSYTRSNMLDALHSRMVRLARQSASVVAEPILNYNFPVIESYLGEAAKDPDIVAMRVVDPQGSVISEKAGETPDKEIFNVKQDVVLGESTLGHIIVEYTTATIDENMHKNMLVIPAYQAVMLIVVAVILIVMFSAYVKNPVAKINRVLSRVTAGDLTVQVPDFGTDDIGSIASGVRFLVERLTETIRRIHSISGNVSEAMHQLNATFEKVGEVVNQQQRSIEEMAGAVRSATDSQKKIVNNTEELLSLSNDNGAALLEMKATSEEIASATESLSENLNTSYTTLTELTQSASQVADMAREVSAAIEGTSTSVEEIFSSVKEVETIVRESAKISEQTTTIISDRGMEAVSNAMKSMDGVESFITSLTGAINDMGQRSQDIGKVLSVISEVTEQLQLLGLNAQIIAAQAGHHGQGFSVVAHEMKELSDRTAVSTREIANIVSSIQRDISGVVTAAGETAKAVQQSKDVVNKTGGIFRETLSSSEKATQMAKKIERAALEQTKGLELIVSATEQVKSRIMEVNTATSEQGKNTAYMLQVLSPIRESMNMTQNATTEQARNARLISDNIELANNKTSDISSASLAQEAVNDQILSAMDQVLKMAVDTAMAVKGNSDYLNALGDEVAMLKEEMAHFQTETQG